MADDKDKPQVTQSSNSDEPNRGRGETVRQTIERVVQEQKERQQPKPSVSEPLPDTHAAHDSTWTGQVLEFVGLGFILVPPALLGEAFLKNEAINWPLMIAIFAGFWTGGGFVLLIGKKWQKWKLFFNDAITAGIEKGARNIWVWLAVLVAIAFGPTILYSTFSTHTSSTPPGILCFDGPCPPTHVKPGPEYLRADPRTY